MKGFKVKFLKECASTNVYLLNLAKNNAKSGIVVATTYQTNGKGSKGRSFYSPKKCGLYFSVLVKPDKSFNALSLTSMTAVCVYETLKKFTDSDLGIKWVNDVYRNGKKVCGILAESTLDNDGKFENVVIGVGINMFRPKGGYPKEIENIADCVFDKYDKRLFKKVLKEFLKIFGYYYENGNFIEKYREYSCILGKGVYVLKGEERKEAVAKAINGNYELEVEYSSGERENLNCYEISLKIK